MLTLALARGVGRSQIAYASLIVLRLCEVRHILVNLKYIVVAFAVGWMRWQEVGGK